MESIITVPNPLLRKKSTAIAKVDKKIFALISAMEKTIGHRGVGLSSVQIGEPLRLFILRHSPKNPPISFINPVITFFSTELLTHVPRTDNPYEGCLSVPKYWGEVNRSKEIAISYNTVEEGKLVYKQEKFSGFPAIVIQHEYDHLEGVLFIDRIIQQKGKLYYATGKKDEAGKEIWEKVRLF